MMRKKKSIGKLVRLTKAERSLAYRALTIAIEDGSLYGDAAAPSEYEPINAAVELLQKKLR